MFIVCVSSWQLRLRNRLLWKKQAARSSVTKSPMSSLKKKLPNAIHTITDQGYFYIYGSSRFIYISEFNKFLHAASLFSDVWYICKAFFLTRWLWWPEKMQLDRMLVAAGVKSRSAWTRGTSWECPAQQRVASFRWTARGQWRGSLRLDCIICVFFLEFVRIAK